MMPFVSKDLSTCCAFPYNLLVAQLHAFQRQLHLAAIHMPLCNHGSDGNNPLWCKVSSLRS